MNATAFRPVPPELRAAGSDAGGRPEFHPWPRRGRFQRLAESKPALVWLGHIQWETAHHFTPVTEFGQPSHFDKYNAGTPIGVRLGNTQPGDGFRFRGRGYVQITGRANYERIGRLLGVDLTGNPERALDPEIAYRIAAEGMRNGWFTGRKLVQYIPSDTDPQFQPARQIINGMDHASDIAALAVKMTATLKAAAEQPAEQRRRRAPLDKPAAAAPARQRIEE